jgi:hypothetical protein
MPHTQFTQVFHNVTDVEDTVRYGSLQFMLSNAWVQYRDLEIMVPEDRFLWQPPYEEEDLALRRMKDTDDTLAEVRLKEAVENRDRDYSHMDEPD